VPVEQLILIICGSVLALSTILVIQDYFSRYFINIPLKHPWDYVAHFLTCFSGILFFSILFKELDYGREIILIAPVIITLMASFFKEFVLDSSVSVMDLLSNFLGIFFGIFALFIEDDLSRLGLALGELW